MPLIQPSFLQASFLRGVFLAGLLIASPALCSAQNIQWQSWSPAAFVAAKSEHKLVILSIEASGSHWCHVMNRETYGDARVGQLIAQSYIAVKADVGDWPELANRYREYEPPVTIIFNADGGEIVRKERFLSPRQMASLLQAVVEDPSPVDSIRPEPSIVYSTSPALKHDLASTLNDKLESDGTLPDQDWDFGAVYFDAASIEYAMLLAQGGNKAEENWVLDRMAKLRKLIDPVWGGVFQSLVVPFTVPEDQRATRFVKLQIGGVLDAEGDSWNDSHYEKPLLVEAAAMRMFAMAYGQWHHADDLAAARAVRDYVREFLTTSDGAFYAGQDSDVEGVSDSESYFAGEDSARRAIGLPKIDARLLTRENGRMIDALCQLYKAAADPADFEAAKRCAKWILSHRSLPGGGFTHAETGSTGPCLCDSLAAGRAFLELYEVSKDRQWLDRADAAGRYIESTFASASEVGFVSVQSSACPGYKPHPDREENAQLARFARRLAFYTGEKAHELAAARAMRYLVTPEIASEGFAAVVLLANREFTDPALAAVAEITDKTREDSR